MVRDSKLRKAFLAIVCAIATVVWAGVLLAQTTGTVTPEDVHVSTLGALSVKGDSTNAGFTVGSCPQIICSGLTGTCECSASGTAQATTPLKKVGYRLQVLSDLNPTTLQAGSGRDCTGAAAILTLTSSGPDYVSADANGLI